MTTAKSARVTAAIGEQVRVRALTARVSQGELAQAASLSRSAVNEHLNGRTPIPLTALLDYCALLGVDAADVLRAAQEASSK